MTTNRAVVSMAWGPQSFQKAVLAPGDSLVLGASAAAGFQILQDRCLSDFHVELSWDGRTGNVRAANSDARIVLNGQPVSEGPLAHGQWFKIGESTFLLRRERPPEARAQVAPTAASQSALAALRSAEANLYAVLDAARDEEILPLLQESPDAVRSLYDGAKGDAMAEVAPYLVQLDRDGWLLEVLSQNWGRGWGIYLSCPLSLPEVRHHLRHFLRVQEEGSTKFLYFRFYDPRVLRVFIPSCTDQQLIQFYGPIRRFWMENEDRQPLSFLNSSFENASIDLKRDRNCV